MSEELPPSPSLRRALDICEGKRGFNTKGDAKYQCKLSKRGGLRLHPYECPYCGMWHTTKQRRKS